MKNVFVEAKQKETESEVVGWERAVVDVVNVTICFDLKVELKKRAGNFTFHFDISIHVHFLLAFHRFVGDFDRMIKR